MRFGLLHALNSVLTAALYDVSGQVPLVRAAQNFTGLNVTFDIPVFNHFALVIRDGDTVIFHSGNSSPADNELDENGDFTRGYIYMENLEVVLTPDDLSDLGPQQQIVNDKAIIFIPVNIIIIGDTLNASGQALYTEGGFFVGYSFSFRLVPDLVVGNADHILGVETVAFNVWSDSGGIFGWLKNIFVNIILSVIKGSLVQEIENTVQEIVNDVVADRLAGAAPAGTTARVYKVGIDINTGLTMHIAASMPIGETCASAPTSGSVRLRSRSQLIRLRSIRDKVLVGTPQGEAYVETLTQFSPELIRLMVDNPKFLKAVDETVTLVLKEFKVKELEKVRISKELGNRIVELLQSAAELGSPRLKGVAKELVKDVQGFVGQPARKVLEKSLPAIPKRQKRETPAFKHQTKK
jgi:hypothetical protein